MVTGANGFLGQHSCFFLSQQGFQVYAVARNHCRMPSLGSIIYTEIELTNVSSVDAVFKHIQPDVVVHIAAMSKPDECNLNKEACLLHNVTATQNLVKAANLINAHFIYCSTDFIFGENGPHAEDDQPNPLNFYGLSKLLAEQWVKDNALKFTIVRPVFIYGAHWEGMRPSFIQWVQQSLLAGKNIKVVGDQFRTPTYALDICAGIQQIILRQPSGVFHLAGAEILTPYQMATTVAAILQLNANLITEVDSNSFPEPVQRAKRSGLKIDKAKLLLNYKPLTFIEGVRKSFKNDLI